MKKTTKTTQSKTPAPAKKTVKAVTKAVKKAVVKKAPVKKTVSQKPAKSAVAAKPVAPAKSAAPAKPVAPAKSTAPAKKTPKPASKAVGAKVTAQVNIGFGNALYLRGEGQGLSWEKGVPMDCIADDLWSLSVTRSAQPLVFKFLVNDEIWSAGEDYVLTASQTGTFTPTF